MKTEMEVLTMFTRNLTLFKKTGKDVFLDKAQILADVLNLTDKQVEDFFNELEV